MTSAPTHASSPSTAATADPTAADEFRFLPADAARVAAPLPRVERVTVTLADGREVSGLHFDPDHTPQLIALHGMGLNAHSFDPMLVALGVPALSIDLPGHGRSSWRDDADYRPKTLASDVAEAVALFMLSTPAQPVVLLGHSLGGLTSAVLAQRHPELFSKLIIVDITPGVVPSSEGASLREFIQGQRDFGSVDEMVDRAIAFGIGSSRVSLTRGVSLNTRLRNDGRLEWTHHFAHLPARAPGITQAPLTSLWPVFTSLTMPVTLVPAISGMVTPELAAEWLEQLPASTVEPLSGPHNLHEAKPVELAAIVQRVLRRSPDGGPDPEPRERGQRG